MPLPLQGAEPEAWLSLDLTEGLGADGLRRLLTAFGSPGAILTQSASSLATIVGQTKARAIIAGPSADRLAASLVWLQDENNHLLTLADEDYPKRLLEIPDPPAVLYLKGRRSLRIAAAWLVSDRPSPLSARVLTLYIRPETGRLHANWPIGR